MQPDKQKQLEFLKELRALLYRHDADIAFDIENCRLMYRVESMEDEHDGNFIPLTETDYLGYVAADRKIRQLENA